MFDTLETEQPAARDMRSRQVRALAGGGDGGAACRRPRLVVARVRRRFQPQAWRCGPLGLTLPKAYGGGERGPFARFVVVEELLSAGAPVAAHWTPTAKRAADPELRDRGAAPILSAANMPVANCSGPDERAGIGIDLQSANALPPERHAAAGGSTAEDMDDWRDALRLYDRAAPHLGKRRGSSCRAVAAYHRPEGAGDRLPSVRSSI